MNAVDCEEISAKKNKRVGIITHYYSSTNYGGNLQSYALVVAVERIASVFV